MALTVSAYSATQSGANVTISATYSSTIGACNVTVYRVDGLSTAGGSYLTGHGYSYTPLGSFVTTASGSGTITWTDIGNNGQYTYGYTDASITTGTLGTVNPVTTDPFPTSSGYGAPALGSSYSYALYFYGAQNVTPQYATPVFNITTVPAPGIPTGSPPAGTIGTAYSTNITSTDATSYAVSSGSLPTGLSLNSSTGRISGTPSVAGPFNFSITATNAYGTSTPTAFSITINALTLSLGSFSPTSGKVATAFTGTVNATNSTSVTISFTSGTGGGSTGFAGLGLTASTTTTSATLSGTPTTPGTVTFSVTATNPSASPTSVTSNFTVTIVGGGKRWNGTSWATLGTAKRWNGTSWVDITIRKRWNGTSWVDISN